MAVVSPSLVGLNMKDSRWLTLEVCREYQRNKCTRTDLECKFAHPPAHVEVQNGRVTCCFDSIKGKCQRKEPPCKYLHPPQHLREQLLQNGRNNLIMRNLQLQAFTAATNMPVMPQVYPMVGATSAPQYLVPTQAFNPYAAMSQLVPASMDGSTPQAASPAVGGIVAVPSANVTQQKINRPDRLESSPTTAAVNGVTTEACSTWPGSYVDSMAYAPQFSSPIYFQPQVVEVLSATGTKRQRDPADDLILTPMAGGMMQIAKRPAMVDARGGMPMYQPATAYQQALAMQFQQQQQFIPVTLAGHPASVQRF